MSVLQQLAPHFLPTYSNYPQGKYISVFLLRQVESEAIFRTEGSGEPLSREFVHPGRQPNEEAIQRIIISKRKQTAVERRTGRELLRAHNLLFVSPSDKQKEPCSLNRNNPCGQCLDCMIYGYAVGGGGAQKSRVVTDDAFSLHPATTIVGTRQFNALFDNGTMRDPVTGDPSTSIGTDEYIKPESIFLDIETVRDVTLAEFQYVLGNILRSSRYGAVSSRIGKIQNQVIGLAFSNCELFSNLEWTQATFDQLRGHKNEPDFPLHLSTVKTAAQQTLPILAKQVFGQLTFVPETDLTNLLAEIQALYSNEQQLKTVLDSCTMMYPKPKK